MQSSRLVVSRPLTHSLGSFHTSRPFAQSLSSSHSDSLQQALRTSRHTSRAGPFSHADSLLACPGSIQSFSLADSRPLSSSLQSTTLVSKPLTYFLCSSLQSIRLAVSKPLSSSLQSLRLASHKLAEQLLSVLLAGSLSSSLK